MAEQKIANETLEGVRIGWRNFQGQKGDFNAEGDRNFVVWLDKEQADDLAAKGWTVKELPPREEGDDSRYFLKVKVRYGKGRPPRVVLISSRGRTSLTENELILLDWADIANVDMIIRAFNWDYRGRTGVTAYLNSIYVTIQEDELELKYSDVPELEGAQKALTSGSTPVEEFEDLGEYED